MHNRKDIGTRIGLACCLSGLLFSLAAGAEEYPFVAWQSASPPLVLESPGTHMREVPLPYERGAFEFRFRPHPEDRGERVVLVLTGGNGYRLELGFHPNGRRWIFRLGERTPQELTIWHDLARPGEWNHVLLSWDRTEEPHGSIHLYVNGTWRATGRYDRAHRGPATLMLGHAERPAAVGFDAMTLYRRPFTGEQATFLAGLETAPETRLARLADRLGEDDRAAAARASAVAQLAGRIGYIIHRPGTEPRQVPLPEGLVAESVRPEDIGTVDLGRFAVLLFPEGPRYQLTPEQGEQIRAYVHAGGGYVGSCQGAFYAAQLDLLDITCHALHVWGLFKIRLQPHPLTDFRREEISMHFGNGPVMVPGEGIEVAALYTMTLPGGAVPAAIVAGRHGAGRVVAFGPHPMGGTVSHRGTRAHWSGKLLETERLLVNGLLYAAGLLDPASATDTGP